MKETRKIIRKILREEILQERLMDFKDDVDMIYEYYFKDDYEKIERTDSLDGIYFESNEYNTSFLNSPLAKKAHKLNPCQIFINIGSNHYNPEKSIISIGVNEGAVNFVMKKGGIDKKISVAAHYLDNDNQSNSLKREFKEESIKGSIHHELTHWVDDTLHNSHIKKTLKSGIKANEFSGNKINYHYMEIEAIIHNIKQIKRKHENNWNFMSFDDLINLSPVLNQINKTFDDNERKKWVKNIKIRMHREGLLGKNMENG